MFLWVHLSYTATEQCAESKADNVYILAFDFNPIPQKLLKTS